MLSAHAQIKITAKLVHVKSVQFEPILVNLNILNTSGVSISLGREGANAELFFEIKDYSGRNIPAQKPVLFSNGLDLIPQQGSASSLDLSDFYALQKASHYDIQPRIEWSGKTFYASKMYVDIVPGLEIEQLVTTLPQNPNEVRICSLRTVHRAAGKYAYLRIDDETRELCTGVFGLGRIITYYKPQIHADEKGQVHVLIQAGPNRYGHNILNLNGEFISQDFYNMTAEAYLETRPDGTIGVHQSTVNAEQSDL